MKTIEGCGTFGGVGYFIASTGECNFANTASTRYRTTMIEQVPDSFFQGLADIENGRTVDLDRALEEPPNQV